MPMNKNLKLIVPLVVLALLIITATVSYQTGFRKGFMAPLAQLRPTEIFSLVGRIKSIDGGALTLEVPVLAIDKPLEIGQRVEIRKVLVSNETKVTEIIAKSIPPDINSLLEGRAPLTEERTLAFNNLQVGDQVEVSARENILAKKEFEATKVSRLTMP